MINLQFFFRNDFQKLPSQKSKHTINMRVIIIVTLERENSKKFYEKIARRGWASNGLFTSVKSHE